MDAQKTIDTLQLFVTHLSNGAFAHFVQGKHFAALGFSKLADKYTAHYTEEMGWVEKFIDRINDLGGEVAIAPREGMPLVKDPVEYVEFDLAQQQRGVELLYSLIGELRNDPTTFDIVKAYLADEEEDLYWSQGQLEMIALIGRQNWLVQQL